MARVVNEAAITEDIDSYITVIRNQILNKDKWSDAVKQLSHAKFILVRFGRKFKVELPQVKEALNILEMEFALRVSTHRGHFQYVKDLKPEESVQVEVDALEIACENGMPDKIEPLNESMAQCVQASINLKLCKKELEELEPTNYVKLSKTLQTLLEKLTLRLLEAEDRANSLREYNIKHGVLPVSVTP